MPPKKVMASKEENTKQIKKRIVKKIESDNNSNSNDSDSSSNSNDFEHKEKVVVKKQTSKADRKSKVEKNAMKLSSDDTELLYEPVQESAQELAQELAQEPTQEPTQELTQEQLDWGDEAREKQSEQEQSGQSGQSGQSWQAQSNKFNKPSRNRSDRRFNLNPPPYSQYSQYPQYDQNSRNKDNLKDNPKDNSKDNWSDKDNLGNRNTRDTRDTGNTRDTNEKTYAKYDMKSGKRAGVNKSSQALKFSYTDYDNVANQVFEVSTEDLIRVIIARSFKEGQIALKRSLECVLRAMNHECSFPMSHE